MGRGLGGFCYPDSRSKTACRATPASASGGGYSEQGLAQRSKKSRKAAARRFFRAPQEGLQSNFEPFCPCHWKIPETPAIARVSGIFLFAKKAQNAAKYAEKLQQKWYKSCTCVGKSWGIPPPEKWLQTQQYQRFTVFSLFARRGNPWGKSTENLKETGVDSNIYHIPTGN